MENKEERHKEKKGTINNLKNGKAMKKTIENVDDRILWYFIIRINQIIEWIYYLR